MGGIADDPDVRGIAQHGRSAAEFACDFIPLLQLCDLFLGLVDSIGDAKECWQYRQQDRHHDDKEFVIQTDQEIQARDDE
ncbi:hypothetical protein D3C87_1847260 [compost metagenome]